MKRRLPEGPSLWKCFIAGDDHAFASIYSEYIDMLYAYGKRYLADEDLLEDCLQELFINLYKYRSSLAPDANIKFYLFSSLKHQISRSVKNATTAQKQASSYNINCLEEFQLSFCIEDTMIRAEQTAECLLPLITELNLLPSRQKEILYLRFNSGLQYEEIAAMLNISVASCRTMVFRAIKQLRKKLENTPAKNLLVLLTLIF